VNNAGADSATAIAITNRCWKSQRGDEDEDVVEDKKRDLLIAFGVVKVSFAGGYLPLSSLYKFKFRVAKFFREREERRART
jgi:hypothetical protein